MRSSVFQYPYDKVLRRTRGLLNKLGMRIVNYDKVKGSITAESHFSFSRPTILYNLVVEEMENHDTKVTVRNLSMKKLFFQKKLDGDCSEAEMLDAITTII